MKRRIVLLVTGILCAAGTMVVNFLSFEDKRTAMNEKIEREVDKRFMSLIDSRSDPQPQIEVNEEE